MEAYNYLYVLEVAPAAPNWPSLLATHDFAKIEITTQVRIFSALTLFKVEKE
jgi:hypothetical protein